MNELKKLRTELKISQRLFAEALGITLRHYQRLERPAYIELSPVLEMQIEFIRSFKIEIFSEKEFAASCGFCLGTVLVSHAIVFLSSGGSKPPEVFCSVMCAVRKRLKQSAAGPL